MHLASGLPNIASGKEALPQFDSTLAIFGEKEEGREGACLPQESLQPQI